LMHSWYHEERISELWEASRSYSSFILAVQVGQYSKTEITHSCSAWDCTALFQRFLLRARREHRRHVAHILRST
jgi:hypothetical protein